MKLFLKIAYLGTAYCGYQVQPNGVTVQEKLNSAVKELFGSACDIVGCSRTDSGVHARGFCATVARKGENGLETAIPPEKLPIALNARLPDDISVLAARWVPEDFHPRYGVTAKEYEYLFWNSPARNPFLRDRAWQIPWRIDDAALQRMQTAAECFVGERDFSALRDQGADTDAKDATRRVFSASVTRTDELISFRVRANGFLYHMVRIMAGTLRDVAKGTIPAEELPARIASLDRHRLGVTAPACGLYLDRVFYPEEFQI